MANAKGLFQITNLEQFYKQIADDNFDDLQYDVLTIAAKYINPIAKELVTNAIENTAAYKALKGFFAGAENGADLPAEFGLSPPDAEDAAENILKAILANLEINLANGRKATNSLDNANSLIVFLSEMDAEISVLNIPNAEYQSVGERGVYNIPWAKWLLDGGEVQDASIVYNDKGDFSRSGRALMARTRYAPYTYGSGKQGFKVLRGNDLIWTFPDTLNPVKAVVNDRDLQTKLQELVIAAFEKAVEEVNRKNV